jgi:hypothetical protein
MQTLHLLTKQNHWRLRRHTACRLMACQQLCIRTTFSS